MGVGPAIAKILLLGSGELGREFVISAKRLGAHVIACDAYAKAPAMQFADECEVSGTAILRWLAQKGLAPHAAGREPAGRDSLGR